MSPAPSRGRCRAWPLLLRVPRTFLFSWSPADPGPRRRSSVPQGGLGECGAGRSRNVTGALHASLAHPFPCVQPQVAETLAFCSAERVRATCLPGCPPVHHYSGPSSP